MRVSEPTFYHRKNQFVGVGVPEIPRLKQLEDENGKLKPPVADRALLVNPAFTGSVVNAVPSACPTTAGDWTGSRLAM